MLVEIVDKTKVQVSSYYFSVLQAQAAGFFKYNWYLLINQSILVNFGHIVKFIFFAQKLVKIVNI